MKKFCLLACVLVALTACSSTKEELGLGKKTPDASKAVMKNPLILPPNYNLRPVAPIAVAGAEKDVSE